MMLADVKREFGYKIRNEFNHPTRDQILYIIDVPLCQSKGDLIVQLAKRRKKKNGEWGVISDFRVNPNYLDEMPIFLDRDILKKMLVATEYSSSYQYSYYSKVNQFKLDPKDYDYFFSELCRESRVFIKNHNSPSLISLKWDKNLFWEFFLKIDEVKNKEKISSYCLTGCFKFKDHHLKIDEPSLVIQSGLLFNENKVSPFMSNKDYFYWILKLRKHNKIYIPTDQIQSFLKEFYSYHKIPPILIPRSIEKNDVFPELKKHAYLGKNFEEINKEKCAVLNIEFSYEGHKVIPYAQNKYLFKGNSLIHRNLEEEKNALRELEKVTFFSEVNDFSENDIQLDFYIPVKWLYESINSLMENNWEVYKEKNKYVTASGFSLDIKSNVKSNWFEVEGKVDFEENQIEMPELLKAAKQDLDYLELKNGAIGILPKEWRDIKNTLDGFGELDGDTLLLSGYRAHLLDALLSQKKKITYDKQFEKFKTKLLNATRIKGTKPGKLFFGKLRSYQEVGLAWLQYVKEMSFGGLLADDMGLGKTVQVLALLNDMYPTAKTPSIIVVPRTLIYNWENEIKKFSPHLRAFVHWGSKRLKDVSDFKKYHIIITTYGTLRNDIFYYQRYFFSLCYPR